MSASHVQADKAEWLCGLAVPHGERDRRLVHRQRVPSLVALATARPCSFLAGLAHRRASRSPLVWQARGHDRLRPAGRARFRTGARRPPRSSPFVGRSRGGSSRVAPIAPGGRAAPHGPAITIAMRSRPVAHNSSRHGSFAGSCSSRSCCATGGSSGSRTSSTGRTGAATADVYRPAAAAGDQHPVLLQIHGGAGSSATRASRACR